MRFLVESGPHKMAVESTDFNHAAVEFLRIIKNKENKQEIDLGDVISVTCEVNESWILTSDVINLFNQKPILKVV